MLFLKYLDDLERERAMKAELVGKSYGFIIDSQFQWSQWAAPKKANGDFDHDTALTGDDLINFVDRGLADRNILADQAFNAFSAFPEDALVRIAPDEIRKKGRVPKNGSIFFTIFQTFMSGQDAAGNPAPSFGDYPPDFFDFIIIDECHRGGANDESSWCGIMEYFSPAVQLGLTATPKRKGNTDTYAYFGDPVYIYSLKEGINDGFLTPFKVNQIATTLDDYIYTSDDRVLDGEVEPGKLYEEADFNKIIEIKEREAYRVKLFMGHIDQKQKTLVFCATQIHALAARDLINQIKTSSAPNYCVRVTANDGALGEQFLRTFQDNKRASPPS
ncbi:MAG: DEAD/DEAH box helicase family protein [Desulfuromonadaceae bacterium]|nr:DEAD/DEAH box helicase family protein [Desulfuromonadaceae bacterium]